MKNGIFDKFNPINHRNENLYIKDMIYVIFVNKDIILKKKSVLNAHKTVKPVLRVKYA